VDIYEKIDEIGEYIEQAKVIPIINQKLLDIDYLMKSLEELYAAVPAEIKQAKEFIAKLKEREEELERHARELMDRTKAECERIMAIAQSESRRLVDNHEIRSMAEDQARQIQTQVVDQIESMRNDAVIEIEEVRRESLDKARELEDAAIKQARKVRVEADQYADEVLTHIESTLTQIQAISKTSRKYFVNHREHDILERSSMN
jgi:hypothetical protein